MIIYLLSGLGADERAFENLVFPSGYTTKFIDWIPPMKRESLVSYAFRMSESIDNSKPFGLLGISFGGMLAVEIAKIKKAEVVILISSTSVSKGIPIYTKFFGYLRIHHILPFKSIGKWSLVSWLFGSNSTNENKLISRFIEKTPKSFLKWAIDAIVRWKNISVPENTFHIHGSKDNLLPLSYQKPVYIIKNGGHLMVFNKWKEINEIITEISLKLNSYV